MAEKKTAHTKGFDKLEDVSSALKQVEEGWDEVGKTDRYSTGFPILDDYLGGGFGSTKRGEVVLIHSTAKTYKSTIALQFIRTTLERGDKVGLIILEGDLPSTLTMLRQLYAPVEINGSVQGYERFDTMAPNLPNQLFVMSRQMIKGGFEMHEIVDWMEQMSFKGVKLFLIDPVGYLADFAADSNIPDYKRESRLMKDIAEFAYQTKSTIICLQHNVKDGDYLNPSHRQSAIGGSQSYSKSATKVIEIRNEGLIDEGKPDGGKILSLEMYMARGVSDWRYRPVLMEVVKHPDGKGIIFSMYKYDKIDAENILASRKDDRSLWYGQLKNDIDNLMGEQ